MRTTIDAVGNDAEQWSQRPGRPQVPPFAPVWWPPRPPQPVPRGGLRRERRSSGLRPVEALAHLLAGLEDRHGFAIDRYMRACSWVAAGASRTILDRKRAEAAQLHSGSARQRRHDLAQDRIDDVFDVALV